MSQSTLAVGIVAALFLAVFAVFLVPSLVRDMRARQVLAHGIAAEAQVVDLTDTGNRVNDQPQVAIHLEVKPADRPPFLAEVVRVVSTADVGLFARGRTIMVKYDPANTSRVAIVEPVR
jgi:hypothetical protein